LPTASTIPSCGFSLAVSGMTIPLLVISSRSTGLTTTRSPSGLRFTAALPLCWEGRLRGPAPLSQTRLPPDPPELGPAVRLRELRRDPSAPAYALPHSAVGRVSPAFGTCLRPFRSG